MTNNTFKILKIHIYQLCFMITLFFSISVKAQKAHSVEHENQADIKVFVVELANMADLKVNRVNYSNQVGNNDGNWFFTEHGNQSDKKIFFTQLANQADIKIFYVEYSNQAGWNDISKKRFFE